MIRRHALTWSAGLLALAFLLTGRVSLRTAWRAIDADLLLLLFASPPLSAGSASANPRVVVKRSTAA